jgi:hypothetical protein
MRKRLFLSEPPLLLAYGQSFRKLRFQMIADRRHPARETACASAVTPALAKDAAVRQRCFTPIRASGPVLCNVLPALWIIDPAEEIAVKQSTQGTIHPKICC